MREGKCHSEVTRKRCHTQAVGLGTLRTGLLGISDGDSASWGGLGPYLRAIAKGLDGVQEA